VANDELYGGYECDFVFVSLGDDTVRGGQDNDVVDGEGARGHGPVPRLRPDAGRGTGRRPLAETTTLVEQVCDGTLDAPLTEWLDEHTAATAVGVTGPSELPLAGRSAELAALVRALRRRTFQGCSPISPIHRLR